MSDSEHADMVRLYFDKYADPKHRFLKDAILFAGLSDTPEIFRKDLHRDLCAFVDGMIVSNSVLADGDRQTTPGGEREQLEYNLFGIWPVFLIQKHAHRKRVEKDILDKSVEDE